MKKALSIPANNNKSSEKFFENQQEDLINKKELSAKLRISVSYINKLMRLKRISPITIGRSVRFKYSEVVAALEKWSTA